MPFHLDLADRLRWYHSIPNRGKRSDTASDWNMYVRILSNQLDRSHNVSESDFETAKRELDCFDLVTVLEMEDYDRLWLARYGLNILHLNINHKKGHLDAQRERGRLKEFEEEYRELNHFDFLLYEHAKELHRGFAQSTMHIEH